MSALRRELVGVGDVLAEADVYASAPLLLLTGSAGTGKTHLLCDISDKRLRAGQVAQRIEGIGQAITALVASILLLLHVQTIDALGGADDLLIRFLTLVGGARMTMWVWVVWVGLLALAAGGFLAAAGPGRERPASNESEPKDAATLW